MVVGILTLFIKIPGNGNHLPILHVKTGILQLIHIVQIHKVALVAAQELGMGFQNQLQLGQLLVDGQYFPIRQFHKNAVKPVLEPGQAL